MPIVQSVVSGLASRGVAKQLARRIPNPLLRMILVSAATALVPIIISKLQKGRSHRRVGSGPKLRLFR